MITLIIPTAKRASMLRTALQSVADQTALDKVRRIYVSENGLTRESEAVCQEFPNLPITYIYRDNPGSPLEHGRILMSECLDSDSEFTSILHDDDWWTPTHLEYALKNLQDYPRASIYGTSHFVVSGESSMLNCTGNLFPWFGASFAPFQPVWELSRLNVLMGELLGTLCHYSTMVMRTEMLRKCTYIWDLNNPFDNDRMLIFALSIHGTLLYNPTPQVFVRNHRIHDCQTYAMESRVNHMRATTRWMVHMSGKSWDVIAKTFAKRMALCPEEAVTTLKKLSLYFWCVPEMARNAHVPVEPPGDTPVSWLDAFESMEPTRLSHK